MSRKRAPQGVVVSEEAFAPVADGVEICYQTFGDPAAEPLLLVMGLGGPMTWWDPELCDLLARKGFFVIRYDNRDTGRSSRIDVRVSRADVVKAFVRLPIKAPYSLSDMAGDAVALLDHLGIGAAHVCGVSMGGMIAQMMALEHPTRVRSLVSIMSTTGNRLVGFQDVRLAPGLLAPRGRGRDAYIENSSAFWLKIASPGYRDSHKDPVARAEETWDRGFSTWGVVRQMLAVLTAPDRTRALRDLRMPVLVVHGLNDRMVHSTGGRATARAIPGSELVLIPGMGHDVPPALFPRFAELIRATADRATVTS